MRIFFFIWKFSINKFLVNCDSNITASAFDEDDIISSFVIFNLILEIQLKDFINSLKNGPIVCIHITVFTGE